MFVTDVNDIKIYNLSAGKSLPEWLTDRRKRSQLKKKIDSRRQIELIQDFDMPGVSTSIRMSPDQQYILATGTYKPRVKCFEVVNLSIKFERCFDSEITCFEVLSDDYSKLVFLQCDRYVEFHAAHGRHYRLRIPRFGRDMKYHKPTCDLFIVGTSSDIYRLNLERGQFLQPYQSEGSCLNTCEINPEHNLLLVGTEEGTVEAWDPRERRKCSTLDVAMKFPNYKQFPSITSLKFKNGLQMGVGTADGHVLLYDIRSREPLFIKDHLNREAVKKIEFNASMNAVCSLDSAMLKIWDENSGKQMAYIESQSKFNDFCTIPNTGMFFFAQEDVKMLTYYIPSLGPAPKWCSFLDNLAEEIESEAVEHIYDDYQFVTKKELEELNLDNLIGTNLLRAYMHGYFIDVRLYNKAKAAAEPFAFEKYRKEKIRQQIEAQRPSRLQLNSDLPKVNQELALKIISEQDSSKKPKNAPNLLEDSRFKTMFENPDFAIDKNAAEFKMLAPVLKRLDKSKLKEVKRRIEVDRVKQLHAEEDQQPESSDDDDLFHDGNTSEKSDESDEPSSDDEDVREFAREMKKTYKQVKRDREDRDREEEELEREKEENGTSSTKMIELDHLRELKMGGLRKKSSKVSLKDRVEKELASEQFVADKGSYGNRSMTFDTKPLTKDMKKREYEMKKHREERKQLLRPVSSLPLKKLRIK
ncbi:nucleolar protein 10 [Hermetia illucens]|uniref:nucleolar protein 10 n=1 Tax=Hermetia illucens TaxID=343691 RepID=UPI0018CC054A|nr:nucleolar protein 10 [Hermetia illucens]